MNSKYENKFYEKYKYNIYSQNGEDGILEEMLKRLEIKEGYVCEFGAWDGRFLSNTFKLICEGYKAILIESDNEKYNELLFRVVEFPKQIKAINTLVSHKKDKNSLDNILKNTDIPKDFDVLSIDIDSYDYQVWDNFEEYKPKIVVIEINSGILPTIREHIHTPEKYQGTSFLPMYELGQKKGYKFVLHTGNMIFIREELYCKLGINYINPLENFRRDYLLDNKEI